MHISMYQASIVPMKRSLQNLIAILHKGAAYAEAKKIDPAVLINSRLFPDMHPLARQVQIASDIARRGAARLAGIEAPKFEDTETTFAELIERVERSIAFLETLTPAQIDGSEEKSITVPTGGKSLTLPGLQFLFHFVMPNVYFHVTTTYNILRHCGVEIGKKDFLGEAS
jgi:uncharacterized protein